MKFKTKMINAAVAAALGTVAGIAQAVNISVDKANVLSTAEAYVNNSVNVEHTGPDKRRLTIKTDLVRAWDFLTKLLGRKLPPVQAFA